jgi:uncharacterized Zn finger protein
MKDKEITCKDCGSKFTFTAGEQEFFKEHNYSDPVRCKACRDKAKADHNKRNNRFNDHKNAA